MGRRGCSGEDICFAKNGARVAFPVQARQAGRWSSWRAGPLSSFSPGRGALTLGNSLQGKQEMGGRLGPRRTGSLWGGASGTPGSIQLPVIPGLIWSVKSLGGSFLPISYLLMPLSSLLPFLLAFCFPFVSFLSSLKYLRRLFAKYCEPRHG